MVCNSKESDPKNKYFNIIIIATTFTINKQGVKFKYCLKLNFIIVNIVKIMNTKLRKKSSNWIDDNIK